MAQSHGSKATLRIGTIAAPTVVSSDITVYADTLGLPLTRDNAETSTIGTNSKKYVPGLKDATLPFEGPFDDAADVLLWGLFDAGIVVNFEYCPAGNAVVGTPKYSGKAFFTGYEIASGVGDANHFSSGLQVTGDVTRVIQ